MRRETLMVLVAAAGFAMPAVAADPATTLKGNWVVDKGAALEAAVPAYKAATPEKQKEMRDGMPDMLIEFTADKATMTAGTAPPEVATYKIARQENNTVWLDLTPEAKAGATPQVEKISLEFTGDDSAKMMKEGEAAALLLSRKK